MTGGVKFRGGGNGGEDLGAIEERRPAINEPRVEALMRLDAGGSGGAVVLLLLLGDACSFVPFVGYRLSCH